MLDFDLEVDVLFECCVDLVRGELGETFFEKVDFELDVEVLFLEIVDVLRIYISMSCSTIQQSTFNGRSSEVPK